MCCSCLDLFIIFCNNILQLQFFIFNNVINTVVRWIFFKNVHNPSRNVVPPSFHLFTSTIFMTTCNFPDSEWGLLGHVKNLNSRLITFWAVMWYLMSLIFHLWTEPILWCLSSLHQNKARVEWSTSPWRYGCTLIGMLTLCNYMCIFCIAPINKSSWYKTLSNWQVRLGQ